ncbi:MULTISPECIES: hypothetical protein [Paenibacillus]|uniref:hypothetical protein n=1 Tax=Paenibacillus TaxID=44249 RepID=UPI00096E3137|nr:hypothetical protein [Paenibacillus odorifer]OMD78898.1 hypothetical protein BSK50_08820 [Paenibacillus odorifer]OMD87891.1 hypothetical protein BSK53_02570 [Paenibacillus odorifer]
MEAIQHAFEAEDYTFSASCMDRPFNSIIKDGDESSLLDLLDKLPIKNRLCTLICFIFKRVRWLSLDDQMMPNASYKG